MNIKSLILTMYPYWILGAAVIWATIKAGYADAVRVEKKAIFNWLKFLGSITLYRIVLFKLFPNISMFRDAAHSILQIPWPMTLTVFWEDACHGLPLLLLQRLIGTKKWTWPIHGILTALVMLEFGMGHVYQGLFAAILLSCYVPYSIKMGKKVGFGTVMVCHTLYDLVTILTLKLLIGG